VSSGEHLQIVGCFWPAAWIAEQLAMRCKRVANARRDFDQPGTVTFDPALMEAYAVNSVKNDTEECIEPTAD
jgi:hypothetical protein